MSEIHIFIIWNKARKKESDIITDINGKTTKDHNIIRLSSVQNVCVCVLEMYVYV